MERLHVKRLVLQHVHYGRTLDVLDDAAVLVEQRPILVDDAILSRECVDGGDVWLIQLYVPVVDVSLPGGQLPRLQGSRHDRVAPRVDGGQGVECGGVDRRQRRQLRRRERRDLRQRGEVRRRGRRRQLRELG